MVVCCSNCKFLFQNDKKEPCKSCYVKQHGEMVRSNFVYQKINRPYNFDFIKL